jgi:hypothetical protein
MKRIALSFALPVLGLLVGVGTPRRPHTSAEAGGAVRR